jgi:hypothetical protein
MINKKFKSLTRRNFNLGLTRLKGVRCEKSSTIHSLIIEIGEHDLVLSDDLYYILDQFGNIYQTIKIEVTIDGFHHRITEIKEKVENFIKIFDPTLITKAVFNKIKIALNDNKDVIQYLKDEKVELSNKFDSDKINKNDETFIQWNSLLNSLIKFRHQIDQIEEKINNQKKLFSGKGKKYSYLEFIEKVSFNEEDIVDNIQKSLIDLRKDVVNLNEEISNFSSKELKLLNLDYERLIIMSNDD